MRPIFLIWSIALLFTACQRDPPASAPHPGFGRGEVRIATLGDTVRLQVEIAENERQQQLGLKLRKELPENAGMIFLFDETQPPEAGFWMFRTSIPLSVAFLDSGGRIQAIRDMEPCGRRLSLLCRRYLAGAPFDAALEVNQGIFAERGVGPGDTVILKRASPASREADEPAL